MSRYPYNTAAWQRLRIAKLTETPLCEVCIRREVVEVATVVDHVLAIAKGGDPFPSLDGLMSMCARCHNEKTNAVDHPSASGFRRAYKGFDSDGNPIDPDGWELPPTARAATPGGLSSPEPLDRGPAPQSRKDLVSCESFATSDQEVSIWV